jgi:hypothetical protein
LLHVPPGGNPADAFEDDAAALRAAFEATDRDGDGRISMIESIRALRNSDRFGTAMGFGGRLDVRQDPGTRDLFIRTWGHVDTDEDGKLTFDQVVTFAATWRALLGCSKRLITEALSPGGVRHGAAPAEY